MKIIVKSDYTTWKYEFDCFTCKSKLRADYSDIKYCVKQEYVSYGDHYSDGGSYQNQDYYYLECPVCDVKTQIQPNAIDVNIPYLLQEKVKKDFKESSMKGK